MSRLFRDAATLVEHPDNEQTEQLRRECDRVKDEISRLAHAVFAHLHDGDDEALTVTYVYLNLLNETQEMTSSLRKLLRASRKLNQPVL